MESNYQTAVEWLEEEFENYFTLNSKYTKEEIFKQAKELEKQQIIDAYDDGNYAYGMGVKEPEQYYNETFKNK
jgi:HEPN domain-containing protein